ncbi:hypothetical protein TYRP_022571 [Tyrophagus putrescentiae]|nr:hypothetical protein TYRP_022571 [Tyrophagus putrescentiae]
MKGDVQRVNILIDLLHALLPSRELVLSNGSPWRHLAHQKRPPTRTSRAERAEAEWKYDLNASYNHELQSYTAHRSENVRLHGGHLIIQARPQKDDGYDFTSGRLISKRAWAYGKFEARAKLPRGKQLWPAIWMLPQKSTYGNYAADGEIDIMEYRGDRVHEISGTLHYGAAFPNQTMNSSGDLHFPVDFSAGFHLWTLEWTRREIRWLLDGKQFHHVNIDRSMWSGKGKNPYKVLAKKVAAVQEVLNDESSGRHHHLVSHKSVLSILSDLKDLNHDFSFHNDSNHFDDDGVNFDKTEDSINASLDRQISVICHNHNTKDGNGDNNANNNNRANNNIRRPYPSEISPTSNSSADSRNQQSSGTADSSSTHSDDRHSENCVTWAKTPSNKTYAKYVTSSPSLRSSAAVPPETIEKRRRLLRSASCKKIKLDLTRLDSRPHGQLQPRKIFKPNIICAPCGKTIGFCRKALLCADCHSVRSRAPPGVIGGRGGVHRKIVVSHFIDQSVRPSVPAILVHLCTEIERRGLGEEGLYRKCGSHRQIRQLKAKFLTSKTGPASTAT